VNAKRIWRANRSNTDARVNWNGGLLRTVNPDNVECSTAVRPASIPM
jgi:hypothetical protein